MRRERGDAVDEYLGKAETIGRSDFNRILAALTDRWQNGNNIDDALDGLAAISAGGDDVGTELLLTLIHQLGLARPSIMRLVVAPDAVDEIAQKTLVRVERSISGFESRSRFRTWLYTVGRNEALMHIRSEGRRKDRNQSDDRVLEVAPAGRLSSIVVGRTTIEEGIQQLPEPYRSTLILRVSDELRDAEIADRLAIPIGTVKSRLSKARNLLAPILGIK